MEQEEVPDCNIETNGDLLNLVYDLYYKLDNANEKIHTIEELLGQMK